MAKEKNSFFVADIFSSSSILDPAEVKTAGQFIVLTHLFRTLTNLDSFGQIQGDIVKSWDIMNNSTHFIFSMRENIYWSDGSEIVADDVIRSIKRQMFLNKANHFNFQSIKTIEKLGKLKFAITLNKSNFNFIRQISYPEFGVLSSEDSANHSDHLKLNKTSGPYVLEKINTDNFELRKNNFYEDFSPTAPKQVRFQWSNIESKISGLKSGVIDFAVPFMGLNKKYYDEINADDALVISHPHIGYTFWLTLNPKGLHLDSLVNRKWLQHLLNWHHLDFTNLNFNWTPAEQLYLPDGLGRPSNESIKIFWEKIIQQKQPKNFPKELTFLTDKDFLFSNQVIKILESQHVKVNVTYYETGEDFFKLSKEFNFDIIQARNDFSSIDLHENLQTTFNPNNPLIVTESSKDQYQHELLRALSMTEENARHEIYKNIALDVLKNGYVVPMAYNNILFFHRKEIDISRWSKLFPEISIWKINLKPHDSI